MKPVYNKLFNFKFLILNFFAVFGLFTANITRAVCPICVIAVGAGLGFSEWLGVDDAISSIWIGAVLVAIILWTINVFKKKGWVFPFYALIIILAYYLLTFAPLYYAGIVGHPFNKIFGTDKIIFGSAVGGVAFLLSHWTYLYLKNKNNGKPWFAYQKIVFPIATLLIISLIIWTIV